MDRRGFPPPLRNISFLRDVTVGGAASSSSTRSEQQVVARSSADVSMEDEPIPVPADVRFQAILNKRGFCVQQATISQVITQLSSSCEDLRPYGITVPSSMETDQPVVRYTSKEFFNTYAPDLETPIDRFEGEEADLDLLLSSIHPTDLNLPTSHMSVDSLVQLAVVAYKWNHIGGQALQDAATYYLNLALEVPSASKLRLVSVTNNELLMVNTFYTQCGKNAAIKEVTNDSDMFEHISNGEFGKKVMKRMLQHSAKCSEKPYFESELKPSLDELKSTFTTRLSALSDFSTPPPAGNCVCELKLGDVSFYANRWILASFSPVFRGMLYGNFAEGINRMQAIPLEADEISADGLHRLLTMLHPSAMFFLWYLLPNEIVGPQDWRGHPAVIDELFEILFAGNLEIVTEMFRLAHKFQISKLLSLCVMMLEMKSDLSLAEKLVMADTYHLPQLMARCLQRMTTSRNVKRMLVENPRLTDDLSCQGHKLLFDRVMELL